MSMTGMAREHEGDESMPESLWKARCSWKFGKKKKNTWRVLDPGEEISAYGVCERCISSNDG